MNDALFTVLIAILGGALRVSTPFLFVSLGECLTEKSGRINLGLEGTLVFGAMTAYALSYHTGSPWLGVLAAGVAGSAFGAQAATVRGRRRERAKTALTPPRPGSSRSRCWRAASRTCP